MPRMLMLVGLPGSGKSTFRNQLEQYNSNAIHISSDDLVEKIANQEQITYNDVFVDHDNKGWIKSVMQSTDEKFYLAIEMQHTIIVDRTNVSAKSRAKYIDHAKKAGYEIGAVVFERPMTDNEHQEWNRRLDRPGKSIPNNVLQQMFRDFAVPTAEEGFSLIEIHNSFKD